MVILFLFGSYSTWTEIQAIYMIWLIKKTDWSEDLISFVPWPWYYLTIEKSLHLETFEGYGTYSLTR